MRPTPAIAALLLAAAPAVAQDTKAGASCPDLWLARNAIFREAGYCFRTLRAIQTFGNAGCRHDNLATLPMSPTQRARVAEIQVAERALACTP